MRNLILMFVACFFVMTNVSAQLGKKLKDKVNNATNALQNNNNTQEPAKEEKAGKVLKSYTVKGKNGDGVYDITENDELIFENKYDGGGGRFQYLRMGKKQFVVTELLINSSNEATMGKKTIVNKNQLANCVTSFGGKGAITLKFYLNTEANWTADDAGLIPRNASESYMELFANTEQKANALQAKILGVEIAGNELNTFAYVAGDGTVIKTTASALWSYGDGVLYFESLANEKALRVTYFENNLDLVWKKASHLVKVTKIPADAIGDYKKVMLGEQEATFPLTKTVNKVIYKDQEKPTTEEISGNFKITANQYNSGLTNSYCNTLVQQLPENTKDKFRKEIQEPRVEALVKAEKEAAFAAQEARNAKNLSSNSSSSNTSSNSKKTSVKVIFLNRSDSDVEIEFRSNSSNFALRTMSINAKAQRSSGDVSVGTRIFRKNGGLIVTITEEMDDTKIIVAQ